MIVEQQHWDASYTNLQFTEAPEQDPTRRLLHQIIPDAIPGQTAIELGCFPGRYLLEIGKKGYILNGYDRTPRVKDELLAWLKANGCLTGEIVQADYSAAAGEHDLVCSFGFIEHFTDHQNVLRKHSELTRQGGLLFIEFPNFSGVVQRLLHRTLDQDNYNIHVQSAMQLAQYRQALEPDFEILYCGHYGNFDFWHDDFKKRHGRLAKFMLRLLYKSRPLWHLIPSAQAWSPFAAILARKR